jgi:imidazole glycerol-phosphate synthase subunit HisF
LVSGCTDVLSDGPLIVPGVGAFGAAMAALRERGWDGQLRERVLAGKPTLAICLGMQILLEGSEEAPGVSGLGVASGQVVRFAGQGKVPQMGWNGGWYYANSYRVAGCTDEWDCEMGEYGEPFVAHMRKGRVWACQFHPELSGEAGAEFVRVWLAGKQPPPRRCSGLTKRLIPCLDIRDGRVVKGVNFQALKDAGDPVERAVTYAAQGADEVVLLDVSATREGRAASRDTVGAIRRGIGIPLTVGGGVRSSADVEGLLQVGADKVAVNTAAVSQPDLIDELARRFGRQCVVVAIDARRVDRNWRVMTNSGERVSVRGAVEWALEAETRGAGEILLTSWDKDGTGTGYDLSLISEVGATTSVPIIASGGGAGPGDMGDAFAAGADAVLAASIFHNGKSTVGALKRELARAGWAVRL